MPPRTSRTFRFCAPGDLFRQDFPASASLCLRIHHRFGHMETAVLPNYEIVLTHDETCLLFFAVVVNTSSMVFSSKVLHAQGATSSVFADTWRGAMWDWCRRSQARQRETAGTVSTTTIVNPRTKSIRAHVWTASTPEQKRNAASGNMPWPFPWQQQQQQVPGQLHLPRGTVMFDKLSPRVILSLGFVASLCVRSAKIFVCHPLPANHLRTHMLSSSFQFLRHVSRFMSLVISYPPSVPKPAGGELVPHERSPHRAATIDDQDLPFRDVEKQRCQNRRYYVHTFENRDMFENLRDGQGGQQRCSTC